MGLNSCVFWFLFYMIQSALTGIAGVSVNFHANVRFGDSTLNHFLGGATYKLMVIPLSLSYKTLQERWV